jgi:hypothetical protein
MTEGHSKTMTSLLSTAAAILVLLVMTPSDASAACRNNAGVTRCDFNIILPTVGTERTVRQFGDPETGPFFRIDAAWVDDNLEPDPVFSTCSLSVFFTGDPSQSTGQISLSSASHANLMGTGGIFQVLTAGDTALLVERSGVWFNQDDTCEAGIVFTFAGSGRADRLFRQVPPPRPQLQVVHSD